MSADPPTKEVPVTALDPRWVPPGHHVNAAGVPWYRDPTHPICRSASNGDNGARMLMLAAEGDHLEAVIRAASDALADDNVPPADVAAFLRAQREAAATSATRMAA